MNFRKNIIIIMAMLCCSCTTMQGALPIDHKPKLGVSYVFGNFYVDNLKSSSLLGRTEIALSLLKEGGEKPLYIQFSNSAPIFPVEIEPGKYSIESIIFLDHYNDIASEEEIDWKYSNNKFVVEEGSIYYLGDYSGSTSWGGGGPNYTNWGWRVDKINIQFEKTSYEFDKIYSNFTNFPKINVFRQ